MCRDAQFDSSHMAMTRQSNNKRICTPVLSVLALLVLAGCAGSKEEPEYVERPVEDLYNDAVDASVAGKNSTAAELFLEVERQHPYSIWATKAQLMSAYAYYSETNYEDAVLALDRFIQLHPGNRDIAYAYYLKGLSYYEQIVDVGRDQRTTELALASLEDVVRRYPESKYSRDAKLKLDLTYDHLAGKEMEIGRFYLNRGNYLAAINRFRNVVDNYQTTTHVPEALYRISASYIALGIKPEATQSAAVLGYNYPGSEWYVDSYQLLTGEVVRDLDGDGKADQEDDGGFFTFSWLNPF